MDRKTYDGLGTITDALGNVTAYTMDWPGRRIATKDPDAGRTSTGYDAAGNITYTIDGCGQRLSFSYDALRGFLGHTEDAGTGLDQVGARYYDAATGRFISPDPMFTDNAPQSLDPYARESLDAEGSPCLG